MIVSLWKSFTAVSKANMLVKWRELLSIPVNINWNPAKNFSCYWSILVQLPNLQVFFRKEWSNPFNLPQSLGTRDGSLLWIWPASWCGNSPQLLSPPQFWTQLEDFVVGYHTSLLSGGPRHLTQLSGNKLSHWDQSGNGWTKQFSCQELENVYVMAARPNQCFQKWFCCKSHGYLINQCCALDPENFHDLPYQTPAAWPMNVYQPIWPILFSIHRAPYIPTRTA